MREAIAFTLAAALLMPMLPLSAHSRTLIESEAKSSNKAPASSPASAQPVMPLITATKTDALLIDNDMDMVADTGDTLKYTVTITNSGSTDATGVTFNDTLDPNTTLVPGSITTTPIAVNDTYAASGNIQISINAASGVLANDNDADGGSLTATAGATSANGGNVSMNPDGSFTYNPAPGFEGADTFTYTITDGTSNDTATVTVNVSGMIWFIDNSAATNGDGRLTSPYNCLSGAGCFDPAAADDPGDNIFLYTGGGSYNGGLTLLANQRLIGQGAGNSLSAITGITPPPGSLALPGTGGMSPTIVSTSNGVNLGTNNLVRGLDFGNTNGAALSGSGFGTLTVREVAKDGNGQALSLSNGTLDAVFTSISSTSSSGNGISLSSVSGSLVSGPTDILNPLGVGISVSNSSADLNFGATSVSGPGSTGVSLQGNTGDITFSVLDITTATGQRGLLAGSNSTGTITATSGTVSTPNAVAVEINGLSPAIRTDLNLTLTSVSASNASHGIVLTNTSGSFTVTGDGAMAGSGGTIQNIISRGVSFIDATNITLGFMNLSNVGTTNGADPSTCGSLVTGTNTGCNAGAHLVNVVGASFNNVVMSGGVQQGINGNNVTNFSLSNSQVINFGDEAGENGIQFKGLFGTSSVTNTTVNSNETDQMLVHNSNGTLTALNITGSSFINSVSPNGNTGFTFSGNNTANMSVVVQNSTFGNNRTDGFFANATNTATMSVNISGSTVQNNGNTGMSVVSSLAANTTYNISNNPVLTGNLGNVININLALPSTGTLQGTIANNVIGTSGVPGSGSPGGGSGINVISNGSGTAITAITGNSINGLTFGVGINIQARDGNNSLNATVTNNTIDMNSANLSNGILVNSGAVSGDSVNVCADISGNNITNGVGDEIRVRRRFATVTFRLPGFAGVGTNLTDVNNFLAAQNTLNGGTVSSTNAGAPGFVGGGPCTSPSARVMEKSGAREYLVRKTGNAAERKVASRSSKKNVPLLASGKSFNHAPVKTNKTKAEKSSASSAPRIAAAVVSTINLNIGTLPAGKSITITFNASINNSVPSGTTQVSNQGTVSGDNFADVLTDDPDVVGTADPTVTPIQAETPPDITCPAPITVDADAGACSASVSFSVTATGQPAPTVDCKIGSTSITSPHTFPVGTTTVMCTASNGVPPDDSCSFTVTVNDAEAPTITVNGANPITVECHSAFTDPGATAHDACDGDFAATASGTVNPNTPGTYTITYNATDSAGNAATPVTRTVNVVDTQSPVITVNGPNPMTVECHTSFTDPGATATDACDGSLSVTSSGTVDPNTPGTYTITYSATDAAGHTTTATRTVNVVDTTPPSISCPSDILVEFNPAAGGAVVTFTPPVGSDSCAGTLTAAQLTGLPSGSTFPLGTTTNTFRVTDGAGLTATCSFNVTVALTSIIGLDSVTLSGVGFVDSYDSTGSYPATKSSLANVVSNGTITLLGSAKVWGNVRSTRAGVNMSGATQVTGNATAGTTVTRTGSATVGGTITNNALAPVIVVPAVTACGPPYSSPSGISGTYSYNASTGDLSLSGVNVATLANGNYCFHNVTVGSSAQLKVNGPVTIKLTGTLNTTGAASINNTTMIPGNLRILSSYSGSNGVNFSNSASAYLVIYAPGTNVTITGAAPMFGTVIGKTLTVSNSGMLHYDVRLVNIWPSLWPVIVGP